MYRPSHEDIDFENRDSKCYIDSEIVPKNFNRKSTSHSMKDNTKGVSKLIPR